jgi:hypothetical protein
MATTQAIDTGTPAGTGRPPRDTRTFWRILLAVIAPLPMLAKGIYYLLTPVEGSAGFEETVHAFNAHHGLLQPLTALDAVFVVGLIPATIAVAWATRRAVPRLTTVGAVIALTGFFAGIALLGGIETPALVTAQHGLNPAAIAPLDEAVGNEPLILVSGLLFILGIVVGLSILGVALWRSRVAPVWMGVALLIGGATHPFIPNHYGQGIGLLVAAAGFAGATVALLRSGNDAFDLPPTGRLVAGEARRNRPDNGAGSNRSVV